MLKNEGMPEGRTDCPQAETRKSPARCQKTGRHGSIVADQKMERTRVRENRRRSHNHRTAPSQYKKRRAGIVARKTEAEAVLAEVEQQYAPDWQKLVANEPAAEKARAESRRLQTLLSASKRALELRLEGAKIAAELSQRTQGYRPVEIAPRPKVTIFTPTPQPRPAIRVTLPQTRIPAEVMPPAATPPPAIQPPYAAAGPVPPGPAEAMPPAGTPPPAVQNSSGPAAPVPPAPAAETSRKPLSALDQLNAVRNGRRNTKGTKRP
jgi:hypothetical protein